ncbi:MAG: PKD domain-containing protein, partial [Gemmatimonadota bacterium]
MGADAEGQSGDWKLKELLELDPLRGADGQLFNVGGETFYRAEGETVFRRLPPSRSVEEIGEERRARESGHSPSGLRDNVKSGDHGVRGQSPAGPPGGPRTVYRFMEDFEGSLDDWLVYDYDSNSGEDYWGTVNCFACDNSWSAWCAAEGDQTDCDSYDDDMDSYLEAHGGAYVGDLTDVHVDFRVAYDIEDGYDFLVMEVSPDFSVWTELGRWTGRNPTWPSCTLLSYGTIGFDQLYVRFRFLSGSSGHTGYEGAYLDNIMIYGVQPDPVACFTASPTTVCVGDTVSFSSGCSEHGDSYYWEFGDDQTSTEPDPVHPYENPGFYTVTLTVTNSSGSDSETKVEHVTVKGQPELAEVTPDEGTPGECVVTLVGTGFWDLLEMSQPDSYCVVFTDHQNPVFVAAPDCNLWSDDAIEVAVPQEATSCEVIVRTACGESNSLAWTDTPVEIALLSATADDGCVTVRWYGAAGSGATYDVYRATGS